MGHQIIQQPDGNLAVFSTVVDNWVVVDTTPEELKDIMPEGQQPWPDRKDSE